MLTEHLPCVRQTGRFWRCSRKGETHLRTVLWALPTGGGGRQICDMLGGSRALKGCVSLGEGMEGDGLGLVRGGF